MKEYEIRKLGQDGYCRICHGYIPRQEELVVTFYNTARKGGKDFLCLHCIKEIYLDLENGGYFNEKII